MSTEIVQWSPGVSLEEIEKQVILKAFRWFRGNKTQCSISLGINVRTLERKLEEYEQAGLKQQAAENEDRLKREAALKRARGIVSDENGKESISGSYSGVSVQPTNEISAQQPVPVSERKEVQSVLPVKAPAGREQRRGG